MIIAAAPNGDPNRVATLFDSLQETIAKSLANVNDMIDQGILNHTISGETAVALGVSLQQNSNCFKRP